MGSGDFFEVGGLRWDGHIDGYKVDDVDYCVDCARDSVTPDEIIVDVIVKPGDQFTVKPEYSEAWGVLPGDRFYSDELVDLARGWATNIDELIDEIDFV